MATTQYQQRVITVPRGQNVGHYIVNDLRQAQLLPQIDVKTIHPVRDAVNKTIVVTLEFLLTPKPVRPLKSLLNT